MISILFLYSTVYHRFEHVSLLVVAEKKKKIHLWNPGTITLPEKTGRLLIFERKPLIFGTLYCIRMD